MQKYAIQFNNKTFTLPEINSERDFFLILCTMAGISFACYLFFVSMTVFNIVDRKNFDNENHTLSSRVSELELAYLNESNKIDLNMAYSLGYQDAEGVTFASLGGSGKTLSLADSAGN